MKRSRPPPNACANSPRRGLAPEGSRSARRRCAVTVGRQRQALSLTYTRRVHQHASGPPVHVSLLDGLAHQIHPIAPLLTTHAHRNHHGVGGFVDVEGIDQHCLGQFSGCAGEGAEYQHAVLVVPRRHKLLGHQVHAIVKTVHQTKVRRAIQLEHAARLLMLIDENDGAPFALREFRVDPLHFLVCMPLKSLVCRQLTARRRRNLQQADASSLAGILVQQCLHRLEPLEDALGEIPALDAETHGDSGTNPILLAHRCAAGRDIRNILKPARRPLDRYGVGSDATHVTLGVTVMCS